VVLPVSIHFLLLPLVLLFHFSILIFNYSHSIYCIKS
jgi:hypothetical protein